MSQTALQLVQYREPIIAHSNNRDFMQKLPDGCMKLIVTSPPYNIGKSYERRSSLEDYLADQTEVISECVRLLDSRGSICWQVGNHITRQSEIVPLDVVLYPIFKSFDLRLRNRIIWHFEHGLHCSKRFSGRYETILWFTKSDDYTFNLDSVRVPSKYPKKKYYKGPKAGELSCNPNGKNPGDVWVIPNVKWNHIEKSDHPCQFPVGLIEPLVLAMTNIADNVFDPYLGVGSTVIAAMKHDRTGYGCDVEEKYASIARERIQMLKDGTLKTRPMDKPVYDPALPYGGHK